MAAAPKFCKALEHLVRKCESVDGRTRLMKLIYLADREWASAHDGKPYTEARYYRWNHGPFSKEFLAALEWMDGIEIVEKEVAWAGGGGYTYRPGINSRLANVTLDPDFVKVLDHVSDLWNNAPLRDLLDHVYSDGRFKEKSFGQPIF